MSRYFLAISTVFLFTVACAQKKKVVEKPVETVKKQEIKKEQLSADKAYTCVVKEDKRRVIVDKKKLDESYNRCEIHYTKFGEKKQMAWAQATPSLCKDVFNKIRKNIEDKGFKCYSDAELEKLDKKTIESKTEDKKKTAKPETKKDKATDKKVALNKDKKSTVK